MEISATAPKNTTLGDAVKQLRLTAQTEEEASFLKNLNDIISEGGTVTLHDLGNAETDKFYFNHPALIPYK